MKLLYFIIFMLFLSCGGEYPDYHKHCVDLSYKVTAKNDPASDAIRRNTYNLCMEIYGGEL